MVDVTLIGLHSGTQLLCRSSNYVFTNMQTGMVQNVFVSSDGKRVYTIPDSSIEFVDEEATEKRLTNLDRAANMEVLEDDDPNSG